MTWETIRKPAAETAAANLSADDRSTWGWDDAQALLDGLPGGGLNIAYEAVDRHVANGHGDQQAMRWLGKDGARRVLTYADLKDRKSVV